MAKSHSQKLRVLADLGHKIVCAESPYEGVAVEFAPRFPLSQDGTGQTDRDPWVIRSTTEKDLATGEYRVIERLSGAQCRVARDGE